MAMNWKALNRKWHANIGMALAITMGLIAISCPFIAHKWDGSLGEILKSIHYGKFIEPQWRWIWIDSQGLGLAFLVASGWLMHRKAVKRASNVAGDDPTSAGSSVTFVGLGELAMRDAAADLAEAQGLRSYRCPLEKFATLNLERERWMVFVAGPGADATDSVRRVVEDLKKFPANKAKRLEFTIDPTLPAELAEKLKSSLARAGAKALSGPSIPVPNHAAAAVLPVSNSFSTATA
jgi:hypothetical protein